MLPNFIYVRKSYRERHLSIRVVNLLTFIDSKQFVAKKRLNKKLLINNKNVKTTNPQFKKMYTFYFMKNYFFNCFV